MTIVKSFDFTLSGSAYGSAIYTNGFPISEIVAPTSASAATALTVQTSLDNVTYSQLLSNGTAYTIPIIAGSASKIPESAFNGIPYLKFAANANVGTSTFSASCYNNYANNTASISHANLSDLQGGGINERYHLSLSQYNNLSGSSSSSGSHNSLAGIQGGSANEYYHLTSLQYTMLKGLYVPLNYYYTDADISYTGSWAASSAGGVNFNQTNTGSSTASITMVTNAFRVYYYRNGGGFATTQMGVYVDNVRIDLVDTLTGANGEAYKAYTCAYGSHVIKIQLDGTNYIFFTRFQSNLSFA